MSFTSLSQCFQKLLLTNNPFRKAINVKYYSRWSHRRPRRVILPDDKDYAKESCTTIELKPEDVQNFSRQTFGNENLPDESNKNRMRDSRSNPVIFKNDNLFDLEQLDADTFLKTGSENSRDDTRSKKKVKKFNKPLNADQEKQKVLSQDLHSTTINKDGNLVFTKVHDNAKVVGSLMLSVKSRKRREQKGCILLEGKRLIQDGILAGCQLETLIFSRDKELDAVRDILPKNSVKIYKMAYRDMQMWSDLTTCPGIMGLFKIPNIENQLPADNSLPLTILCDNVRDPGNLGSILRAAAAVGCQKLLLVKGCVELWDTKVLRSAAGAHFRLSIQKDLTWDEVSHEISSDATVFIAETNIKRNFKKIKLQSSDISAYGIDGVNKIPIFPYHELEFSNCSSLVLIIGGETEGISEEAYNLTLGNNGIGVHIPLLNGVESLNSGTALGIIAFEMRRQFALLKSKECDRNVGIPKV